MKKSDYVPNSNQLLAQNHIEINRRFDSVIRDYAFSVRKKCENLNIKGNTRFNVQYQNLMDLENVNFDILL